MKFALDELMPSAPLHLAVQIFEGDPELPHSSWYVAGLPAIEQAFSVVTVTAGEARKLLGLHVSASLPLVTGESVTSALCFLKFPPRRDLPCTLSWQPALASHFQHSSFVLSCEQRAARYFTTSSFTAIVRRVRAFPNSQYISLASASVLHEGAGASFLS